MTQMAEAATAMRKTTKRAESAAHINFRCQAVGQFLMRVARARLLERDKRDARSTSALSCQAPLFGGSLLLIIVFVLSIFWASVLFSGSSASAFCQASSA